MSSHNLLITFVVKEPYDIRKAFELFETLSYAEVHNMKRVGTEAYEVSIYTIYGAEEVLEDLRHVNVSVILIVTEGGHEDFKDNDFEEFLYPKQKPKNRVTT